MMEQPGSYAAGDTIDAAGLRVVRRLDSERGCMAQVYLATYSAPSDEMKPVVVKIANVYDRHGRLHTEALQSEAAYLAELSHPHIVRPLPTPDAEARTGHYTGQTRQGGYTFLVLEHLTGGSLSELLQRRQRGLAVGEAVAVAYALASALDYVHARGLVHLDVAPHNVLLRTALDTARLPDAVLIDFGSACRVGRQEFTMQETFHASAFLPPEVLRAASTGDIFVQPSIDVYALGAVLYTLLNGKPPFAAENQRAQENAIQHGAYPPLRERWQPQPNTVPPAQQQRLDELVRLAMQVKPENRCDAARMARELYEIGFHLGLWPVASANTSRMRHGRERSLLVVLAALSFLVFGAGFGAGVLADSVLPPIFPATMTPGATATATATNTSMPTAPPTNSATPTALPTNSATPTAPPTVTSTPPTTATRAPTATPVSTPSP